MAAARPSYNAPSMSSSVVSRLSSGRDNSAMRNTSSMTTFSLLDRILSGEQHIVAYPGTGQYTQGGLSACGLAAMNCVRLVLDHEVNGTTGSRLVSMLSKREFVEEVMSICSLWPNTSHLEPDEIYATPFFSAYLTLADSDYGQPDESWFKRVLSQLEQPSRNPFMRRSSAVVITRPPEIVVCIRITHPEQDVFAIFDSHPRNNHPDGAAFILNTSLDRAARYLADLLPFDKGILSDTSLQWQAQMIGNVSGHILQHSNRDLRLSENTVRVLLDASIKLLSLKVDTNQLKSKCSELGRENERLHRDIERLENENIRLERERDDKAAQLTQNQRTGWLSWYNKTPQPTRTPPSSSSTTNREHTVSGSSAVANRLQRNVRSVNVAQVSSANRQPPVQQVQTGNSNATPGSVSAANRAKVTDADPERDFHRTLLLAARMQREFEEEDTRLRSQATSLKSMAQATFECILCMDEHPEESVAHVDGCDHKLCRDCLRQYISSKIQEHRYPVFCPVCTAQTDQGNPGTITLDLILQIGVTEDEFGVFEEMQLSGLSIMLVCRQCKQSAFVDKAELEEMKVLACPFPNCNYIWCRLCQQPVPIGGPEHSCDGSKELQLLMNQRGWKHCPGCKTPTEKIDGCNHMTCMTPACNTHFCYVCGKMIVQSALRATIKAAVETHYRTCQLFEDVPDQAVDP